MWREWDGCRGRGVETSRLSIRHLIESPRGYLVGGDLLDSAGGLVVGFAGRVESLSGRVIGHRVLRFGGDHVGGSTKTVPVRSRARCYTDGNDSDPAITGESSAERLR